MIDDETDDQRLGKLERHANSIDQRLGRVEGKQDAMLAWQQAHSERVTLLDARFDTLEKLMVEIRDRLNGHGS